MPKIVDKQAMRERILMAAFSAFVKYGFGKTTMTKIAQEAGIVKGTLYLYFKSKQAIVEQITNNYFSQAIDQFTPKKYFQRLNDLLDHIKKTLLICDEEALFIPIFFEVFGSKFTEAEFVKEYTEMFDDISKFYSDNIEILIQNKQIHPEINSEYLSRSITSMLDGFVLHKGLFKLESEKYKNMVKESISFLKRGMQP